jgi:malonyl CoA-acyl carrier protein transacylase
MFAHDVNREEAVSSEVTVDDVSPEVLSKFLDFAMGKEIELSNSLEAAQMLVAADKYDVSGLVTYCEQKVGNKRPF